MNFRSAVSFDIKEKDLIPPQKILANFEKINNTSLTFGVHAEDNDNHATRDSLQDKKLHSVFYGDMTPIGNAALLKKSTTGFTTEVFVDGKKKHLIVTARPVIEPLFKMTVELGNLDDYVGSGLKKQLSFENRGGLEHSLNAFSNRYLSFDQIKKFVEIRGGSYWSSGAKHNSPYVAAIKALEMLGEEGLGNVYNRKRGTINKMSKWDLGNIYKYGDRPLIDSYDMLKSIKAKVNKG